MKKIWFKPGLFIVLSTIVVRLIEIMYDREIDITLATSQMAQRSDIYMESAKIADIMFPIVYIGICLITGYWFLLNWRKSR